MNDIVVSNVSVSFDGKAVLRDLSHTFKAGSLTCIMGASGCGKTTLLNVLLGNVLPENGNVSGMPKKTACVFQEDRLCEDFTAPSNVKLTAAAKTSRADCESLLSELGINDFKSPVKNFSGGMKRRVALARAIAANCDVVLLDEAFKGLDDDAKANALKVFLERSIGKTVIAVTHDSDESALMNAETLYLTQA